MGNALSIRADFCEHCHEEFGWKTPHSLKDCVARLRAQLTLMYDEQGQPIDVERVKSALTHQTARLRSAQSILHTLDETTENSGPAKQDETDVQS